MADPNQLEILIKIKEQLEGLNRTQTELKKTKDEAKETGGALGDMMNGLGIARMLTLAGGIAFVTGAIKGLASSALNMAEQIKNGAENLNMSTTSYQVYGKVLKDAGGDAQQLTQAHGTLTRALVEARQAGSAMSLAFRTLGLDHRELERMKPEDRWVAIGRAVLEAGDSTDTYNAATQILGTRGLPTLLTALKQVATEGYDHMAESAKAAGQIMEDETIKRLEKSKKLLEDIKNKIVISAGETVNGVASGARILGGDVQSEVGTPYQKKGDGLSSKMASVASDGERTQLVEEWRAQREQLLSEADRVQAELNRLASRSVYAELNGEEAATKKFGAGLDSKDPEAQARMVSEVTAKRDLAKQLGAGADFLDSGVGKSMVDLNASMAPIKAKQEQDRAAVEAQLHDFFDTIDKQSAAAFEAAQKATEAFGAAFQKSPELKSAYDKSQKESAFNNADDEGKLALLDQELQRIEQEKQLKLEIAASAKNDNQRTMITNDANMTAQIQINEVQKQRQTVLDNIAKKEQKAAVDAERAAKQLTGEEKKRRDDELKAIAIREKADLDAIRRQIELANNNPNLTKAQREQIVNGLLAQEKTLLDEIIARRKQLAGEIDPTDKSGQAQNAAEIQSMEFQSGIAGAGTPKKRSNYVNRVDQYEDSHDDASQMDGGQSILTGLMDASDQLGTSAENIAGLFSGTILESVNAISEGIYGWVTGSESFGDVMRNLGDSVFKEMLSTIIRIGMQWLINTILVKTGIISIGAVQDAQRTGQTAKTTAANAAVAASAAPGAAATGISSFGMALIFGALALALIMGAASMFATGGGVNGGKQLAWLNDGNDGPEFVMRGSARSKYGDAMLNDINAGRFDPSDYASSALASTPVATSTSPAASLAQARGNAPAAAGQSVASQIAASIPEQKQPLFNVAQFSSRSEAREWLLSQEGQKHLVDTASDNRAEMGIKT